MANNGGSGSISISRIIVIIGGLILFIVGIALLLAVVHISFLGATLGSQIADALGGLCFLGLGLWIIWGGKITA